MADQLYVALDASGRAAGFYRDSVHGVKGEDGSKVPSRALPITEDQWHEFRANPQQRAIADPASWDPRTSTLQAVPKPAPDDATLRSQLRARRDALLERTDFIPVRHSEEKDLVASGDIVATTFSDLEVRDWQKWRRDLRALPIDTADPSTITLPGPPGPIRQVVEVTG